MVGWQGNGFVTGDAPPPPLERMEAVFGSVPASEVRFWVSCLWEWVAPLGSATYEKPELSSVAN